MNKMLNKFANDAMDNKRNRDTVMKMKKNFVIFFSLFTIFLIAVMLGCSEKREPYSVTTHPGDWVDENSPNFHGKAILDGTLTLKSCQTCHGTDYSGGTAKVACASCHELFPHAEGFADRQSPDFHANYIITKMKWNIVPCQQCHGNDYAGEGVAEKNCMTSGCHTPPEGPEACNTCHGSSINDAPPPDLHGNIETTAEGVGAHQSHLQDTTWSTAYVRDCNLCHVKPTDYEDPLHVLSDNTPGISEITFDPLASDTGKTTPAWSHETATCSNVYCHGAFTLKKEESSMQWAYTDSVITGNYREMLWTSVGSGQADCGTCHDLPPKGHIAATTCNSCHPRVVDADNNIINKKLHIDGKVEVF